MHRIDNKHDAHPSAINDFGYFIPLYVISVLNKIVVMKMD